MIKNEPNSPELEILDDEDLVLLLDTRIRNLQANLKRAERRQDVSAYNRSRNLFLASVVALLAVFALAIAPYLGNFAVQVPSVISYVSAFAVLFFAYLCHRAFRSSVTAYDKKGAVKYALDDGRLALANAVDALGHARQEEQRNDAS